MIRGFITIATGNKYYCRLAANLLLSYRYFSRDPLPFAIIAEEENEYTALFDDVILLKDSTRSFLDKFQLLTLCPYDETIFLDADSLAYGDLNAYWDFFRDATDFSAVGENVGRHDNSKAWYNVEDLGKYGESLPYKSRVHAGVMFIRSGEKVRKMYDDCMELYHNFHTMHFHTYPSSVDECVFGVAMPMNGMEAVPESAHLLAFYPCLAQVKADILHGKLSHTTMWGTSDENAVLLHWGTAQTHEPLYRYNEACLHYLLRRSDKEASLMEHLLYERRLCYAAFQIQHMARNLVKLPGRGIRKVKRMVGMQDSVR